MALPALHLVQRVFPEAERRLLTNFPVNVKAPPAAAILESTGLVEPVHANTWSERAAVIELHKVMVGDHALERPMCWFIWASARGVQSARRGMRPSFRICGVRKTVGIPLTEALQQNYFGAETAAGLAYLEPEAARLARNILSLGDAKLKETASWDLRLTDAERTRAGEAIGAEAMRLPKIAVSVGYEGAGEGLGSRQLACALLAQRWRPHLAGACVAAGGGSRRNRMTSEFAAEGWRAAGGGPVVNLCGALTPRESAAAFQPCRACLSGHDSGPMHLAAAVGTRCVAIFAARNIPRVWFPYGDRHRVVYHEVDCMGCGLETCVVERKKCILVDHCRTQEVLEAVTESLVSVRARSPRAESPE